MEKETIGLESEVHPPEPNIRDTNFIQRDLITRSGQNPLEWIKEKSDEIQKLVNSRPELFYGYAELNEEEKVLRLKSVEAELNQFLKEAI